MKIRPFLPLLAALFAATLACRAQDAASPAPSSSPAAAPVQDIRVVLHTDKGDVEATLYAKHAPMAAANFLNLAQRHFYDGLKFHRVIADFMIQGGDPSGGMGGVDGPGYSIDDEPNDPLHFDKAGVFAMANKGRNTSGSQFFITHNAVPWLEDSEKKGHYTIFGQVTKGQEVVNAVRQGDKIRSVDILDATAPLFAAQAKHIEQWNTSMAKEKEKK